ncbi:platelet basic protein [Salminus brasiliensis]|uniref:platelet basic protein n=1 Tax=Salminus brasiliensis TaxID=930266 RepID=UPI003B835F8F
MIRSILLLLVSSLMCATVCTALRMDGRQRCICITLYKVKPWNIMNWQVHRPSASCGIDEIVVTLRNQKKVCLDPNTKAWRIIMQRERGAI